jgi:hypothetical protein
MWMMKETRQSHYALKVTPATWVLLTGAIWWPTIAVFPGSLGGGGEFFYIVDLTILNALYSLLTWRYTKP